MVTNLMRPVLAIGRAAQAFGRVLPAASLVMALSVAFLSASCAPPEPKTVLKTSDVETYWILDPSRTSKRYLAPAMRFTVENISPGTLISVEATGAFLLEGKGEPWGSGFFRLTEGRKRMAPGEKIVVSISSDARYTLEGDPETAFANPKFQWVEAKYFLKVGSSAWVEFGRTRVENVLGSKEARAVNQAPKS